MIEFKKELKKIYNLINQRSINPLSSFQKTSKHTKPPTTKGGRLSTICFLSLHLQMQSGMKLLAAPPNLCLLVAIVSIHGVADLCKNFLFQVLTSFYRGSIIESEDIVQPLSFGSFPKRRLLSVECCYCNPCICITLQFHYPKSSYKLSKLYP